MPRWTWHRAEAVATASEAVIPSGLQNKSDLEPCAEALADYGVHLDASLHSGSVADVWRATLPTGEQVAVKLLKRRWLNHPGAIELIRREHRTLSAMRHPNIVRAVDLFESSGCRALATEYLACGDLVSLAGSAPEHWVDAALSVVSALEHVHVRGYVHGDVKARNVLFDANDRAKLIDFGSALPLAAPLSRGREAPNHVSRRPGSAQGPVVDGASAGPETDIYALAVLLYELLSGRLPPAHDGVADALRPRLERLAARSKTLLALGDCVIATLEASDAAAVGTLMQFGNVLESVRSEARHRSWN